MSRALAAGLASTLCGLLLAGCGWVSKSVEILGVVASPDGLTLDLTIASCSTDLRVEIEEDAGAVAVWVSSKDGLEPECAEGLTIQLAAPLGNRSFVDGHDFTEVEVRTGDS